MTNSTFQLFEVEARSVGLLVETTAVWLYGETCECGCRYMVLSGMTIMAHCKTIQQVREATLAVSAKQRACERAVLES